MAQASRDKQKDFKDNQRHRLSMFLEKAGLSTEDSKRLVEAFFDIKIEKTTGIKDITKVNEAPTKKSPYEKILEELKICKAPIDIN